jgi:hypothetical protein
MKTYLYHNRENKETLSEQHTTILRFALKLFERKGDKK